MDPNNPTLADLLALGGGYASHQLGNMADWAGDQATEAWRGMRGHVGMDPGFFGRMGEIGGDAMGAVDDMASRTIDELHRRPAPPSLADVLAAAGTYIGNQTDALGSSALSGIEGLLDAPRQRFADEIGKLQPDPMALADAYGKMITLYDDAYAKHLRQQGLDAGFPEHLVETYLRNKRLGDYHPVK